MGNKLLSTLQKFTLDFLQMKLLHAYIKAGIFPMGDNWKLSKDQKRDKKRKKKKKKKRMKKEQVNNKLIIRRCIHLN